MKSDFSPVTTPEQLDVILTGSGVLFLHDPFCPISFMANRQVSNLGGTVHRLDVSSEHELKRAVEARTGVRHESPQLFVFEQGNLIWSASHMAIRTDAIRTARDQAIAVEDNAQTPTIAGD